MEWLAVATAALAIAGCAYGGDSDSGSGQGQGGDSAQGSTAGSNSVTSGQGPAAGAGGATVSNGAGGAPVSNGDNGDSGEHGNPTYNGYSCVGGAGPPNDLSHVPKCPNSALGMYPRFSVSRSEYYHDGTHFFEPQTVAWDDAIAAVAQKYADDYANGAPPVGPAFTGQIGFETFYMGDYGGYLAFAGMETPTSCDCTPGNMFNPAGAPPVFYHQGSAYSRTYLIRVDGYGKMGIGHHVTQNGYHYWTFLFGN